MLTAIYSVNPGSHLKYHVVLSRGTEVTSVSIIKLWFIKFKVRRQFRISRSGAIPTRFNEGGFWLLSGFHSQVSILSSLIELSYKRFMESQ